MGNVQTTQAFINAVYEASPDNSGAHTAQLFALGVYDGLPIGLYARASQLFALAAYEGEPHPDVQNASASQLFALGIYGTGAPEDLNLLAWSFTMDGHKLYVLRLGELGTYVYDQTTGLWSKWDTEGYAYWNNFLGFDWDGRTLAADKQSGTVWQVSPIYWNDEGFKDIKHVVTAIIPATGRVYHSLDELELQISSGYFDSVDPYLLLEYSDDKGTTWEQPADALVMLETGEFDQDISWQGLGSFKAPGRVIRITDVGGPINIDIATMRMDGKE